MEAGQIIFSGTRLTVAVIDANPLLADGISALLRLDDGFSAQALVLGAGAGDRPGYDVIMIDPTQTAHSPGNLARDLGNDGASLLAYTSSLSSELARACIAAGFRGVLPKTVSIEVLKTALATTAQGGIFIDATFSSIARQISTDAPPKPTDHACLSARELFVLKSVAHGKTMKEIGKELSLSAKTVETYKARGSNKLNLSGRRQIVEFAISQRWVEGARSPLI